MESRQEDLSEAEGSAVGSYIRSRGGEGGIWHRRGALEFRRFDEVEPQIHCYWDSAWGPPGTQSARARQKPPSKFLLEFSWNTAHDSNEMNLTDTAMTLEHYVDWK